MANKYLIVGAGCAGLLLAYMMYKGAGKAVDAVKDAAQAVNPWNNDNIFNQAATSAYQATGSNNTTIGSDTYTLWHLGDHPTNEQIKQAPMGAGVMLDVYQWATGSTGNQIDDFNTWWEGLTK